MPTLRFANPELNAQFLEALKALPFALAVGEDGTVRCTDEQWSLVNGAAHRVRDRCFPWYFTWRQTAEDADAFTHYLRARGLRHELEHHEDGLVFLLPRADRARHDDFGGCEACSFCGASLTERSHLFGSYVAAICDVCLRTFHDQLTSTPQASEEPES